jgi:hypothetical protein
MSNEQVTQDMLYAVEFLETLAYNEPNNADAVRALNGAKYLSMALDGLSNMMRSLPAETQMQIARDMFELVNKNREGMHLIV